MSTRRDFLKHAALAASALAATRFASARKPPKRLLILGGTKFLGPALVASARARGWTVTLFNRGKTNPELFPDLEKLHGDRNGDLKALEGRQWDAVVDDSGYFPRQVRDSAGLLKNNVHRYVFISSISVYSPMDKPGIDERSPVGKLTVTDPAEIDKIDKISEGNYGPLKALCEQAAEHAMPGRTTVIRPGLIVGPDDPSDRFTYWPVRFSRGGEVLTPGSPSDPVQIIDVRDLAEFAIKMIDDDQSGVYNACGPRGTLTIGALLEACKAASPSSGAHMTWADAKFLESQKVTPWGDMPVWVPPASEEGGMGSVSNKRAVSKGLVFRPMFATVRDTLAWWNTLPEERRAKLRAGIAPEREKEVLAAWHSKRA